MIERDFGKLKDEFFYAEASLFGTQRVHIAAVKGVKIDCNEEKYWPGTHPAVRSTFF